MPYMSEGYEDYENHLTMEDRTLFEEEVNDLLFSDPQPPEITYSNQDFPVDALVKRIDRGSMRIPQFGLGDEKIRVDGFQRGFVWSKAQMDKFIESLLLGYPVPGVFLVKQTDNIMLVLDGQQRLETLRRFYKGVHNDRVFKLDNVGEEFKGLTYENLNEELRFKLDDSYLHATIVVTDGSKVVNDAIYGIFERLNSGGTQLTPHEIRVALYAGPLMVLVEKLNAGEAWRQLYGEKNKRIRDHELIMRILALYLRADSYKRPLKKFLNDFSSRFRSMEHLPNDVENLFIEATETLIKNVGKSAFRRVGVSQLNAAQAEAIMVATMRNLANGELTEDINSALDKLRENAIFTQSTTRATADNEAVMDRLREATLALRAS